MAIELVEKYLPYVDEQFTEESKKEYLTNTDFSFSGAKTDTEGKQYAARESVWNN